MSHLIMRATAFVVVALSAGACADVPGDPDTIVFDGKPLAGYAWSGPGSDCCDHNGMANVGWQIWFTNTDDCPASTADLRSALWIITPELAYPPSTQLPQLASMTVPIAPPVRGPIETPVTETYAVIGWKTSQDQMGRLDLATFTAEEIAGTFNATVRIYDEHISQDRDVEVHGTFHATRCSRIHD